jgi:hypothetical protein
VSSDSKDVLYFFGGVTFILILAFLVLHEIIKPKPLELCLKAGYEWVDGDCVRGAKND